MSSITNVNNNSSVVTVGRTTPVSPGQQPAEKSIPVVLASDQTAIPVEEQNKVQSEVALSLLGIPRAEVALGIFADVNTYDVNPSEWSSAPEFYLAGHGIKHLPNEAGALVEAPRNKTAVLTSKRFFRYQPGRVSAATFGIKSTISEAGFAMNPVIRKYGIFDNFDGYYWETRQNGKGDNFTVVRRTQSVGRAPSTPFGIKGSTPKRGPAEIDETQTQLTQDTATQIDDYRYCGKGEKEVSSSPNLLPRDREILIGKRFEIAESVYNTVTTANPTFYADLATAIGGTATAANVEARCKRDFDYWIDFFLLDMEWGGTAHTIVNVSNFTTALIPDYATYEGPVYTALKTLLTTDTDFSATAQTKFGALVDIITANLDAAANGPEPTWTTLLSGQYGSRSAIDTIYDVKKQYWGYFVSTFADQWAIDNPTATWTPSTNNPFLEANRTGAVYYNSADQVVTDDADVVYTGAYGKDFTLAEVKYKCQRDVADFVIEGFKNDIVGGGNAETKYNMSMYYKKSGLSVGSQNVTEADRHAYLRKLILFDLVNRFGYNTSSSVYTKQDDLSTKVVTNFSIENVDRVEVGTRGFAGNLVTLRDGLIMVHAGVYDPALLKDKKQIRVACDTDNTLKLTEGTVTFGQHVRFSSAGPNTSGIGGLTPGVIYKVDSVLGPKGNEFTLVDAVAGTPIAFNTTQFSNAEADGNIFFETVVPFIMPKNTVNASGTAYVGYDPEVYRLLNPEGAPYTNETDPFPEGMMFPYMYANTGKLYTTLDLESENELYVGYVNTALQITGSGELIQLRDQIDDLNFVPEYINWVKNNVKPEFWGVYEYRVPRSRYSFDKLDGLSGTTANHTGRLYSDVATGDTGIVRPGQAYAPGGEWQPADSLYNFDFTKVTMLKIEFSWYGAVGALFLAYVPVDNGEARWVRVHHLRASNQLKIASLGNATLPITYNVYGGGDTDALGDGEEALTPAGANYESNSHNIVKYGASYYIDGGDRGTVRLYSHNNEDLVASIGKRWKLGSDSTYNAGDNSITLDWNNSGTPVDGIPKTNVDPRFFMGARLKTSNSADQAITVIFADATKVYLSQVPNDTNTANYTLLPDRARTVYGLESKRVILSTQEGNAVRNRVQVYPTKMSTANLSSGANSNPVRLRFKKTPIFQTDITVSGTISISENYDVTADNLPLPVTESSAPYIANGESLYGWIRGVIDGAEAVTAFGRLYKEADFYYFEVKQSFSGVLTLIPGQFLPDLKFDLEGNEITSNTKVTTEKEGLSSILIATNPVVPIPNTGTNVATLYLQAGTEQFDLSSYFDYNKEYLSFPLTDTAETLYFAVDSDTAVTPEDDNDADNISIGITWEEQ